MADKYIDSNATGTDAGTSWTDAYPDFATAAASDAAGDVFYVASDHSETTAAAVALDWAGTAGAPTRIICADKTSGSPPATIATGAVVAVTGANNLTLCSTADYVYFYGIRFKAGNSTNAADIADGSAAYVFYDNCAFELGGNNSGSDFVFSGLNTFLNSTFKSANTGSIVSFNSSGTRVIGCSIEAGGTPGSTFFAAGVPGNVYIAGFDLSTLAASANLFNSTTNGAKVVVANCKMPASWSGSINNATPGTESVFTLMNCDGADTQYRLQKKTQFGNIVHDTSIYRTAGASNGTTNISWAMTSNADAEWIHQTLDSPEIVIWNETTGSSVTATVEFLINSATTLYKEDVWMEVMYLGTSGTPLGSFDVDSRLANYLTAKTTTECDAGTGVANWTGDGAGAKSYKMVSTFTPQEKGFIHVTVKLAKASTTIYVDPKVTLS